MTIKIVYRQYALKIIKPNIKNNTDHVDKRRLHYLTNYDLMKKCYPSTDTSYIYIYIYISWYTSNDV